MATPKDYESDAINYFDTETQSKVDTLNVAGQNPNKLHI